MKDGLEELDRAFDEMLREFPEKKRELCRQVGDLLYDKVQKNIETSVKSHNSKINRGKLQEAVIKKVGTGGGYAVVKNDYKVCNYAHLVENGHRMVTGGRLNKKDISKGGTVKGWVEGKFMYRKAAEEAEDDIYRMAEKMLEKVAGKVEI